MPKFLFSVILIILSTPTGLLYLVFKIHPTARFAIPFFLLCLWICLSYSIALILFLKAGRERKFIKDQKEVFRKKLKRGFLVAIAITLLIALKIVLSR